MRRPDIVDIFVLVRENPPRAVDAAPIDEDIYRNTDKGKVVRMRTYWKRIHPKQVFRIDRLVRTLEDKAL